MTAPKKLTAEEFEEAWAGIYACFAIMCGGDSCVSAIRQHIAAIEAELALELARKNNVHERLEIAIREREAECELKHEARAEALRYRKSLTHALHVFRATLSQLPAAKGLARGELICLIGLDEELNHVKMGRLSYSEENEVREALNAERDASKGEI